MEEVKIYEFHGSFGMCIVCAKNEGHAREKILKDYDLKGTETVFSMGQEIPEEMYICYTMEIEQEEGILFTSVYHYLKFFREENEYKVLTKLMD